MLIINKIYIDNHNWRVADAYVVGRKNTNNSTNYINIFIVGELLTQVLWVEKYQQRHEILTKYRQAKNHKLSIQIHKLSL